MNLYALSRNAFYSTFLLCSSIAISMDQISLSEEFCIIDGHHIRLPEINSPLSPVNVVVNKRQLADLELLLNGGFEPLQGFMNQADYDGVVEHMRLSNNELWPMPITLDISADIAKKIETNKTLALRSPEGPILALLQVTDVWKPNKLKEAQHVFGTTNTEHPGVAYLLQQTKEYYVGGTLIKKSCQNIMILMNCAKHQHN